MKKEKITKDESFWRILSSALDLDVKKGHLKWTLSELARKSGITRSLIYYYFGRSKIGILKEAVSVIGNELIGAVKEREDLWEQQRLEESMLKARSIYEKTPSIGIFYLENIHKNNEISVELRTINKKFTNRLRKYFPEATKEEIEALYTIYWGMCFVPDLSSNGVLTLTTFIRKSMKS